MPDVFMRRAEVERAVGLKHSQLYLLIKEGRFPKPVAIGPNARRWPASDIAKWQQERIAERDVAVS